MKKIIFFLTLIFVVSSLISCCLNCNKPFKGCCGYSVDEINEIKFQYKDEILFEYNLNDKTYIDINPGLKDIGEYYFAEENNYKKLSQQFIKFNNEFKEKTTIIEKKEIEQEYIELSKGANNDDFNFEKIKIDNNKLINYTAEIIINDFYMEFYYKEFYVNEEKIIVPRYLLTPIESFYVPTKVSIEESENYSNSGNIKYKKHLHISSEEEYKLAIPLNFIASYNIDNIFGDRFDDNKNFITDDQLPSEGIYELCKNDKSIDENCVGDFNKTRIEINLYESKLFEELLEFYKNKFEVIELEKKEYIINMFGVDFKLINSGEKVYIKIYE